MQSVITSKYQTTIPKGIRSQLRLSVSDTLEWKIENGRAVVLPGGQIIHTIDFETLLKLWPDKIADFGDAIVAAVCNEERNAKIATFDEKFIRALHAIGLNTVPW